MFFVLIACEAAVVAVRDRIDAVQAHAQSSVQSPRRHRPLPGYRLNDMLASISLGTVQQLALLLLEVCGLGIEVGGVWTHQRGEGGGCMQCTGVACRGGAHVGGL